MKTRIFDHKTMRVCASLLFLLAAAPLAVNLSHVRAESITIVGTWDFGDVMEGAALRHEFTFRNETGKLLHIVAINTSCGCVSCHVQKVELAPGETTAVKVQLETKSNLGAINLYADLYTDNQDKPINRYLMKAHVH